MIVSLATALFHRVTLSGDLTPRGGSDPKMIDLDQGGATSKLPSTARDVGLNVGPAKPSKLSGAVLLAFPGMV